MRRHAAAAFISSALAMAAIGRADAVEPVPGLDLVAPAEPFAPGHYAVTLVAGGVAQVSVICLAGPGLPQRVPADASSAAAWSALASARP